MVYLFKMVIFYSYVSLPEGNHFQKIYVEHYFLGAEIEDASR